MFAAAMTKQRNHLRVSTFFRYFYCSSCHRPCRFTTMQGFRKLPLLDCVKSIPIGTFWIWPLFQIQSYSVASRHSIATQASPSHDMHDEILNQILSVLENSAISCEEVCTFHFDKLCSAGDLQIAARLMQSLHEKRIFLGPHAYNSLLKAAAEQDDIDILSQSFKNLLVFSNSISSASCLIIAKAFMKRSDNVFLLRFVREVSELTFPRSAIILNRIIFAFGEFRQVDKALLIFEEMKTIKCKPDLVTYNTILAILGRCGRADDMLHQFASMKEANIVPDTISYNTIINSLRKIGRLDLGSAFFKEMSERGVEPDLQTYTALIDNFGRSGNIEEALRLFDEMKHRRIRPSIYVYRSLISNLNKMGKSKLATKFSKEMDAHLGPKDFKRKNR